MKDFIYLKNISSNIQVEGRCTTFTAVFRVVFSDAGKGFEALYLPQIRKYMKRNLIPDLDRKTLEFTISKTVRCAEGDTWDEEVGKRLARVKVEIEACKVKGMILRKLKELLIDTSETLEEQIMDTDFRKGDETKYYLDSTFGV